MPMTRRLFLLSACALPLAACSGVYQTSFPATLAPTTTRNWRVTAVQVDVPQSLSVSEAHALVPEGDIVWREDDPSGDRHAQVARIIKDAITLGAKPLRGGVPVVLNVVVSRFHALTFEAETQLSNAGVHNIQFDIQANDARNGAILAGPVHIQADLPAWSGPQMAQARLNGVTQKSMITSHVAQTIQAWLGIGADNRSSFTRLGD